jgi:DNA-binding phage protein
MKMGLTTDFRETVQADIRRDPVFRRGMLSEALESLLSGELELAKEILRDYINATVGFPKLAAGTGIHVKTIHQMFGPKANPTASRLFEIIAYLQEAEGVRFEVRPVRAALRSKKRRLVRGAKRKASAAVRR